MHSERTALDLIGSIYDAAGDPTRWPTFLLRLGDNLKSRAATIYIEDLQHHRGQVAARVGFDDEFMVAYGRYYRPKNIYLIRGERLLWPGNVCLSEALCPDAEARRTEFYNDFVAPQRLTSNGLNGVILKEQTTLSMVGLIREIGTKPYTERDVEFLRLLMPHLQRAVQLHTRITDLQIRQQVSSEALNSWALGVIVLNSQGHVLHINRAAEAILAQKDGLEFQSGQLHAATSTETSALHALIHNATQTSFCQPKAETTNLNGKPGGALSLPRPSGKRPLNVLITPACANKLLLPVTGAAAIIFVTDSDATQIPDIQLLAHYYSLTPAEACVAALVIEGKSLPEASNELEISLNTAKTHLRRIFDKTGTRRQGELIRLALQSPAAILMKNHPIG
jgi:DNA-binding CsgD family transcriptional regulator/PAS domain-containing protein